jgi:tryptophan 2,3-dioxygenase
MSEQPHSAAPPSGAGRADGEQPLYYWDYLQLGTILDAQRLESEAHGATAHDEMLFIIVHQAYELWFKQILWELGAVARIMGSEAIPEKEMARVVAHLERVVEIQKLLIQQIDVLETMTPLDFLEFRDHLVPASGFQSVQFRLIENVLGVDPDRRLKIKGMPYWSRLTPAHQELLHRSEETPTLVQHVNRWLERTPFLTFEDFDFWHAYRESVGRMIERERRTIETNPTLEETDRQAQLEEFEQTVAHFEALFDRDRYAELAAKEGRALSHEAFLAAVLIHLYRDEPILHLPFRLLTVLVAIDEELTAWKYRHALMVHRMIGGRIGTGGTSGHVYLRKAAERHKVFRDLFDVATFLVPRTERPELPDEVRRTMGFRFDGSSA